MLIIVRLGSHRRKAWSTELCTETGLACMIGMLCCHVLLLQHAMLAPAQLLFDCLHIGMWRRLKIQSQRSRGVCSSKKGGSMHVNTILEINKHINGTTKFQIPFSRRNLKLAFLRIAIPKTDFPKTDFSKTIFIIWSSKFPISISKRGCASQHPTSASHSIKYVTQK
jgi:hypothetical protein